MDNIQFGEIDGSYIPIGEVKYGTVITEAPGQKSSIYMKVDKHKVYEDVNLTYTKNYCVLINLRLGSIRAIHGSSKVRVLSEKLILSYPENAEQYRK